MCWSWRFGPNRLDKMQTSVRRLVLSNLVSPPYLCQNRYRGPGRPYAAFNWLTSSALRCRSGCSWSKDTCSSRPRTRSQATVSSDCEVSPLLGRSSSNITYTRRRLPRGSLFTGTSPAAMRRFSVDRDSLNSRQASALVIS